jgi:FkbM family methyltransferase
VDKLVIDVGMHAGHDTARYLSLGYTVVGIEANPVLAHQARERFAKEIAEHRLQILAVAIAEENGFITLGVAEDNLEWSTLVPDFIDRNERAGRTRYRYVEVPARTFRSVIDQYGVPYYLKVDIEGMDMACVRALEAWRTKPEYLSIETSATSPGGSADTVFDELATLSRFGYTRFAYVDQKVLPVATSGPFGDDLPVAWLSVGQAAATGLEIRRRYDLAGFGGKWTSTAPGQPGRPGLATRWAATVAQKRLDWLGDGMFPWYDLHSGR